MASSPAILYGGKFENQKISIAKKDVKNFIGNESFLSTVFEIELDGKREKVLPRDVAYHVTTNEPIHLDLMRIVSGTKIIIEIPVKFINNNESPGLKRGGVLNIVRRKVELKCPADSIPEDITIDLAGTDIGTSIKISSVNLPENVTPTITDRDFVIATVAAPTVIKEPEKPAEGEAVEGAEGEGAVEGAEAGTEAAAKDGEQPKKDEKGKETSSDKKSAEKKPAEKKPAEKNKNMLLLVGLGNPGPNSENNRHNIGFKIIDAINSHFKLSKQKPKFKGLLTTGNIESKKVYAIKPLTFMNNSGTAIKELIDYFKIDAKNVIVFHDDLDIDFGKVKAKIGGSSAGHNGIKSIDKFIGTDYSRVRVGIGHPKEKKRVNSHVLEDFKDDEEEKIKEITENIVKLVPTLIDKKIDLFSSKVNQNLNGI